MCIRDSGSANAVNLTDGLDGLAIVPVMIVAMSFAFIAYISGNIVFSNYLLIQYIPGTGELAVFCGSLIGAALGFYGLTHHLLKFLWVILDL